MSRFFSLQTLRFGDFPRRNDSLSAASRLHLSLDVTAGAAERLKIVEIVTSALRNRHDVIADSSQRTGNRNSSHHTSAKALLAQIRVPLKNQQALAAPWPTAAT
jgi:hypothetical protein